MLCSNLQSCTTLTRMMCQKANINARLSTIQMNTSTNENPIIRKLSIAPPKCDENRCALGFVLKWIGFKVIASLFQLKQSLFECKFFNIYFCDGFKHWKNLNNFCYFQNSINFVCFCSVKTKILKLISLC